MAFASAANLAAAKLAALTERLRKCGFEALDSGSFDEFAASAGDTVVLFCDDPSRGGETWDVAVILPEVLRDLPAELPTRLPKLRCGFLLPEAARLIQPRYGFSVWPTVVLLRDGGYVGALEGIRDWAVYQREIVAILQKPVSRPPTLGIAVRADGDASSACH
jgi:hydrogenase-1 operon protein HyaE